MESLKLNSGLIRLEVDRDGEKGEISFNPNDVRFVESFYKARQTFLEKEEICKKDIAALEKNTETDAHGVPVNAGQQIAAIKEFAESINEIIDTVFGVGTSRMLFGESLVLDMYTQFFESITPYIQGARENKLAKYRSSESRNVMR